VVLTAIGSSSALPGGLVAGTYGVPKHDVIARGMLSTQFTIKTDTYAINGATASGARAMDWDARYHAGWYGNVYLTGSALNAVALGPNGGVGEVSNWLETINQNTTGDTTYASWFGDRSFGSDSGSAATYPGTNTGEGDYHSCSAGHAASRIPVAMNIWPFDIQGTSRKSDGTGYAGAYEGSGGYC
jgi:hypothetical protein